MPGQGVPSGHTYRSLEYAYACPAQATIFEAISLMGTVP
jgi:hypothetical protein